MESDVALILENEIGFEAVFKYATVGIIVVDEGGCIRLLNPKAEKIFGYSSAELNGQAVEMLIPENIRQLHEQHRQGYFKRPKVREMGSGLDLHARHKSGSQFPVEISLGYYQLQGKKLAVAFITDISERKEAERQLKASKERMENVLRSMADAFVSLDSNWRYTFVNDKALKLMGKSREELLGHTLWEVFPDTRGTVFEREYTAVMRDRVRTSFETHYPSYDMWLEVRAYPHEDGISIFYSDISKHKKAEQVLKQLNEELESRVIERTSELADALQREKEMNELKSRFVALASHEFRTPLSAILSSVSLIAKYTGTEHRENRERHIERIKASVKNLTDILNDFLSLEKLEQGKMEAEGTSFNLRDFASDAIEEVKGMARENQSFDHRHNGEEKVMLDQKMTRNILLNLLSNAVKYSNDTGRIVLRTSVEGEEVSIEVQDNGIGIPLEEQKHMFDKFFRARNTAGIQGTGLGLNIVKRYAELMGGNIGFSSIPGEGTTFTVKLIQSRNIGMPT